MFIHVIIHYDAQNMKLGLALFISYKLSINIYIYQKNAYYPVIPPITATLDVRSSFFDRATRVREQYDRALSFWVQRAYTRVNK